MINMLSFSFSVSPVLYRKTELCNVWPSQISNQGKTFLFVFSKIRFLRLGMLFCEVLGVCYSRVTVILRYAGSIVSTCNYNITVYFTMKTLVANNVA